VLAVVLLPLVLVQNPGQVALMHLALE